MFEYQTSIFDLIMASEPVKKKKFVPPSKDFKEKKKAEKAEEKAKALEPKQYVADSNREITIYTWGNKMRKTAPKESKQNFNVCGISYKAQCNGISLKIYDGRNEELRKRVTSSPMFERYVANIVKNIEENDHRVISVNCHKGRHRSVSTAIVLQEKYYPKAKLIHMEL